MLVPHPMMSSLPWTGVVSNRVGQGSFWCYMIDVDYPTIEQAYNDLSTKSFAVWIRFMTATQKELSSKTSAAKLCQYSLVNFHIILNELHNKGYIKYTGTKRPYAPLQILLSKRAMISGRTNFVMLSGARKITKNTVSSNSKINDKINMKSSGKLR